MANKAFLCSCFWHHVGTKVFSKCKLLTPNVALWAGCLVIPIGALWVALCNKIGTMVLCDSADRDETSFEDHTLAGGLHHKVQQSAYI